MKKLEKPKEIIIKEVHTSEYNEKLARKHLKDINNIIKRVSIEGGFLGREKHIVREEHLTKALGILKDKEQDAELKYNDKNALEDNRRKNSHIMSQCKSASYWAKYCVDKAELDLSEIGLKKNFQACAETIADAMEKANKLTKKDFEDVENEGLESVEKAIKILKANLNYDKKNISDDADMFISDENTVEFYSITDNNSDMIEKIEEGCKDAIKYLQDNPLGHFGTLESSQKLSTQDQGGLSPIRKYWNGIEEEYLLKQKSSPLEDEDGRYYGVKAVLEVVRRRKELEEKASLNTNVQEELMLEVPRDAKSLSSSQTSGNSMLGSLGEAFSTLLRLNKSPKSDSKSLDEINVIEENGDKKEKFLEKEKFLNRSDYTDKSKTLETEARIEQVGEIKKAHSYIETLRNINVEILGNAAKILEKREGYANTIKEAYNINIVSIIDGKEINIDDEKKINSLKETLKKYDIIEKKEEEYNKAAEILKRYLGLISKRLLTEKDMINNIKQGLEIEIEKETDLSDMTALAEAVSAIKKAVLSEKDTEEDRDGTKVIYTIDDYNQQDEYINQYDTNSTIRVLHSVYENNKHSNNEEKNSNNLNVETQDDQQKEKSINESNLSIKEENLDGNLYKSISIFSEKEETKNVDTKMLKYPKITDKKEFEKKNKEKQRKDIQDFYQGSFEILKKNVRKISEEKSVYKIREYSDEEVYPEPQGYRKVKWYKKPKMDMKSIKWKPKEKLSGLHRALDKADLDDLKDLAKKIVKTGIVHGLYHDQTKHGITEEKVKNWEKNILEILKKKKNYAHELIKAHYMLENAAAYEEYGRRWMYGAWKGLLERRKLLVKAMGDGAADIRWTRVHEKRHEKHGFSFRGFRGLVYGAQRRFHKKKLVYIDNKESRKAEYEHKLENVYNIEEKLQAEMRKYKENAIDYCLSIYGKEDKNVEKFVNKIQKSYKEQCELVNKKIEVYCNPHSAVWNPVFWI